MSRDRIVWRENQGRETEEKIGIKKVCIVNKDYLLANSVYLPTLLLHLTAEAEPI